LPAHAVEIDSLDEQQIAQDLAGLTRALLHFDDRIAWLAALRAPWCGLTWADLCALCGGEPRSAIWDLLQQPSCLARLSGDGRRRVEALTATLAAALRSRAQTTLSRWVEQTWLDLDGPECLDEPAQRLAAEQFFSLLGAAERRGDLDDPATLQRALEATQPQADPPREQGIEIMTMHRAKGLEFDTVVLLGLGRERRPDEPKALQWMGRVTREGRDDLLMVPNAFATDPDVEKLTDFVRRTERERDLAERARLLYVASTRARERLHLVWQLPAGASEPSAGSLLDHLWPVVGARTASSSVSPQRTDEPVAITPVLRRLAAPADGTNAPVHRGPPVAMPRPEFSWAGDAAVHVGTVVHRHLQRLAERDVAHWQPERIVAQQRSFRGELELLGVEPRDLDAATTRVIAALTRAVTDPKGRWLLGPREEARSELRLTVRVGTVLEHIRLDRTFVAEGQRWIIDFKTSQHQGGDTGAFLDSEVARYEAQLARYARAIAALDSRPVRLGLYFPLLAEFRSWPAAATETPS
jgi:ATP-dependent exoDNAse (exonuclease V) beta subunit